MAIEPVADSKAAATRSGAGRLLRRNPPGTGEPPIYPAVPSVCVDVTSRCHVVGSRALATVVLGPSQREVRRARVELQFAPGSLDILDVRAGSFCDSTSPFLFADYVVDQAAGRLSITASTPNNGSATTHHGGAIACLQLAVRDESGQELCVDAAAGLTATWLEGIDDIRFEPDNSQNCPEPGPGEALHCTALELSDACTCGDRAADCTHLSSACSRGFCDPAGPACSTEFLHENQSCDDGRDCTHLDTCIQGVCRGFAVDCPWALIHPELTCLDAGTASALRVWLADSPVGIARAKLVLHYDPSAVVFERVDVGETCEEFTPFTELLDLRHDEQLGQIVAVVGTYGAHLVTPLNPAAIACVRFRPTQFEPTDVCAVRVNAKLQTVLYDAHGQEVAVAEPSASDTDGPVVSCMETCAPIPATSTWGLAVAGLLLATAGKLAFGRHRPTR